MQYLLIAHHGTIGTCFCEKLAKFSQENQNESSSVVITIDDNNTANKFWILHWREREFLKKKKLLKSALISAKNFVKSLFTKKNLDLKLHFLQHSISFFFFLVNFSSNFSVLKRRDKIVFKKLFMNFGNFYFILILLIKVPKPTTIIICLRKYDNTKFYA